MYTLPAADEELNYLVRPKSHRIVTSPLVPFDDLVCEFLNYLSIDLMSDSESRAIPDVMSFAYWCRKSNISKQKLEFAETRVRLGRGLVFHIAPANVPVNFAFSFVFALLSGNASIVRVSSKDFLQTIVICRSINKLFALEKFSRLGEMAAFVRYSQNDAITAEFSSRCNARIIWGGDHAIKSIRKLPIPERGIEVVFSDRYSFCILDAESVFQANDVDLAALARGFFNDVFLMGQNACSSPHLVVWKGAGDDVVQAKQRFWSSVFDVTAEKFDLQPVDAVEKFTLLCQNAIDFENIEEVERHGNYLYRIALKNLPVQMDSIRGKFGMLYEYHTEELVDIAYIVNSKYQTLTYYGVEKTELLDFVVANRLSGIDRIVAVGAALDIGVIWDGYDIVRSLSRVIDFQ